MRKVFVEPVVLPEPRFRDGLGVRYVRTEGTDDPVEVLRPLWDVGAMQTAIRQRVARLASFRQARFVPVRAAEVPRDDSSTIEVVSDFVSGYRLSQYLEASKAGAVSIEVSAAIYVLRELLGALALLHESRGLTHGAIGPERILVTPKGRVVVADYVLGPAIERLEFTRARLWREFRIPLPAGKGAPRLDDAADVVQVGVTALAMLVGRPMESAEYPDRLEDLLGAVGQTRGTSGRLAVPAPLIGWLKRALGKDPNGKFTSVRDARMALETVLSKHGSATGGATALKSLAETFGKYAAAREAEAAARAAEEARKAAAAAVAAALDASRLPEGELAEALQQAHSMPAFTLLSDAPAPAADPSAQASALGVPAPPVADLEPPVGWRVPEPPPVEETLPTSPLIEIDAPADVTPAQEFVEEVLDLSGLATPDEEGPVAAPEEDHRAAMQALTTDAGCTPDVLVETGAAAATAGVIGALVSETAPPPAELEAVSVPPADSLAPDAPADAVAGLSGPIAPADAGERVEPQLAAVGTFTEQAGPAQAPSEITPAADHAATEEIFGPAATTDTAPLASNVLEPSPQAGAAAEPEWWLLADPARASAPTIEVEVPTETLEELVAEFAASGATGQAPVVMAEGPIQIAAAIPPPAVEEAAPVSAARSVLDEILGLQEAQAAAQASTRTGAEALARPAVEPAVQPATEPVVEAAAEPIMPALAEAFVAPAVELAVEPAVEPATEPVVEAAAEPTIPIVAEAFAVPVAEPAADEALVEQAPEPTIPIVAEAFAVPAPESAVPFAAKPAVETAPVPAVPVAADSAAETLVAPAAGDANVAAWSFVEELLHHDPRFEERSTGAEPPPELFVPEMPPAPAARADERRETVPATPAPEIGPEPVPADDRAVHELPPDWFIEVGNRGGAGVPTFASASEAEKTPGAVPAPAAAAQPPRPDPVEAIREREPVLPPVVPRAEPAVPEEDLGEPIFPRVAPSVRRVRAEARRRRLVRIQHGIGQGIRSFAGGCASGAAAVAGGVLQGFAALGRGAAALVLAVAAGGLFVVTGIARAFAGALRLVAAGLTALGGSVAKGGAAIARGGVTVAAAAGSGMLRLIRGTAHACAAIFGLLLTGTLQTFRTVARGLMSTARAGSAAAVTVLGAVGRGAAGALRGLGAAFAALGRATSVATVVLLHGIVRTARAGASGTAAVARSAAALSAGLGRAGGRIAARATSATVAAGGASGHAAASAGRGLGRMATAPARALYFAATDLAESLPKLGFRAWYLAAALLVIAAVAGVPFARAKWFAPSPPVGTIRVESVKPDATVTIDGVAQGRTPVTATVPVGRHRIEVTSAGSTRAHDVDVSANRETFVQSAGADLKGVGAIRVTSDPPGAEVRVDGAMRGTAPVTVDNVLEGAHTVEVRDTSGSVRTTVSVKADETAEATVQIRPGWLAVFAPVKLDILENGRSLGSTERGRILTPPGVHTLEITSREMGFRETRRVEIRPGEVAALTIEMPPASLEIVAPAEAEILVDGQAVGTAPLGPISVAVGTREITMRHPVLGEKKQVVSVTYKAPARVVFE